MIRVEFEKRLSGARPNKRTPARERKTVPASTAKFVTARARESFRADLLAGPTIDLHGVTARIYDAYLYAKGDN